MVIGDLSHVFALDVRPIVGQALLVVWLSVYMRVCLYVFSVYLFVCISGCMFFSVFLFVCSPLCMVIGDLSHVFALDVSPIRGQALASPPFRQRAATQNVFRHGKARPGKFTFGM